MAEENNEGDIYYYDANGNRICMIYDHNDFFTVFVQLMLAAMALGSLYIKRMQEHPRRKFSTWLRDVSKQGVGATYAHFCNMLIAAILATNMDADTVLQDQCAWYGISYLIDTTLGLVLAIWFIWGLDWLADKYDITSLKHSGLYSGPDACKHWTAQTIAWIVVLTVVKILIYLFMWVAQEPLAWSGGILFAPLQGNIRFELMFVMILFPGVLNVIYFWIADGYLKAKGSDSENTDAFESEYLGTKANRKDALLTDEEKEMTTMKQTPDTVEDTISAGGDQPSWTVFGNSNSNWTGFWGKSDQTNQPQASV